MLGPNEAAHQIWPNAAFGQVILSTEICDKSMVYGEDCGENSVEQLGTPEKKSNTDPKLPDVSEPSKKLSENGQKLRNIFEGPKNG